MVSNLEMAAEGRQITEPEVLDSVCHELAEVGGIGLMERRGQKPEPGVKESQFDVSVRKAKAYSNIGQFIRRGLGYDLGGVDLEWF